MMTVAILIGCALVFAGAMVWLLHDVDLGGLVDSVRRGRKGG